jgi:hypothetical protein
MEQHRRDAQRFSEKIMLHVVLQNGPRRRGRSFVQQGAEPTTSPPKTKRAQRTVNRADCSLPVLRSCFAPKQVAAILRTTTEQLRRWRKQGAPEISSLTDLQVPFAHEGAAINAMACAALAVAVRSFNEAQA